MDVSWSVIGLLSLLGSVGAGLVVVAVEGRTGRRGRAPEASPEALAWIERYHLDANPFDGSGSETAALVRLVWRRRARERRPARRLSGAALP